MAREQEDITPQTDENAATVQVIDDTPQVEPIENQDQEFNPDYEEQINIQQLFADDEVYASKTLSQDELFKYSSELRERSHHKIEQLCEFMAKKQNISAEWQSIMPIFIRKAVEDVNIDSISASGEPMDINFYVKIKKIPFIDQSVTGYFKGVVFRKNVVHKKMRTKFSNPKLMIITGSLEAHQPDQVANFENMVNNERKNIKRIVDRIAKMKPDLLLVEKSANRLAIDMLLGLGISVVQNIQQHILRKIAKCTKAKFINLEKVDQYQPEKVLGVATNLVFRQFNAELILQDIQAMETLNENQKEHLLQYLREAKDRDNTLMFLETPSGQSGVTLTLSGPHVHQLKCVKKSIMGILRLARHFHLERELIIYEHRLKSGLKVSKDQLQQINSTTGDLTKFVYERMPLEDLIRKDAISYTKINYVEADLSNFNDIKDNHLGLQQYFKENHPMSSSKVDFFAEICQIPTQKKIEFYSKDDTSLAAFILLKVSNMENKCQCRRSRIQHVSIYYGSGVYIKIAVESRVIVDRMSMIRPAEPYFDRSQSIQPLQRSVIQSQLVDAQQQQQNDMLTSKDLAKVLAKKHKNQNQVKKVVIESYLECNICSEKLTDTVRLKKINMEYSFLRFLQHLFISGQNAKEPNNEKKAQCDHQNCSRVFVYEEAMVKFFVSVFKPFSVSQISLTDDKTIDSLKKWEIITIQQKREELRSRLSSIKDKLILLIMKLSSQLSSDQRILKSELDQLCSSITKIYNDAHKKTNSNYRTIFEVEMDSHIMGMCFREIYENILESQRKKEIGNDLKIMMKNQLEVSELEDEQSAKTDQDLDQQLGHSDDLLDSNSVQSDKAEEAPRTARNLRKCKTFARQRSEEKLKSQQDALMIEPATPQISGTGQVRSSFMSSSQAFMDKYDRQQQPSDFNFQKEWPTTAFPWEQDKTERTIQKFEFIPIHENDHMSYIAFALNHSKYMHEVYLKEKFQHFESQKFPDLNNQNQVDFVRTKLAQGSVGKEQDKDVVFTLRLLQDRPQVTKKQDISPSLQAEDVKISSAPKQKTIDILIYFPAQFEMLRMINNISLTQFLKSIVSIQAWDCQGGKSESTFFKSSDDIFVFKKLTLDKEFVMFRDFAREYFKHMWRLSYENKPSLLGKIYGMFEIRSKNGVGYYLAMENLFQGMGPQANLQVYDLKGSKTNRWEQKKKRVLLDTNFKIDRNAEPIPVLRDNFRYIDRAFQNDCKFLVRQKVVDYSLLCIIDKKNQRIRLGIIDYLRYYTWDKETEHIIKLVLKGGMVPTIVNPQEYKKRFLEEMSKYFIDVSNEN